MKKFCEVCGNPIEGTPQVVPVIYRAKETEFIMCDKCFDKVRKMFIGGQSLRPEMR
nr:MAG TPA: zinc finger protein [Caudoviricetes sp.]